MLLISAEGGAESTGVGLKASLGQAEINVGNVAGLTLGLSLDTGFAFGKDGGNLKAIGTGVEFSRSKGFKFCVFGSCLGIG